MRRRARRVPGAQRVFYCPIVRRAVVLNNLLRRYQYLNIQHDFGLKYRILSYSVLTFVSSSELYIGDFNENEYPKIIFKCLFIIHF